METKSLSNQFKTLQSKMEEEQKSYNSALNNDQPFWKLKEIYLRIKELAKKLKTLNKPD
jgi:hypothetical protein